MGVNSRVLHQKLQTATINVNVTVYIVLVLQGANLAIAPQVNEAFHGYNS